MAENPFELFGLPESFRIDTHRLGTAWRELQAIHHPDRAAGGTDTERRRAVEYSTAINDAYAILRDDFRRASWLLERRGIAPEGEPRSVNDPDILMEQMELREHLTESADGGLEAVERIGDEVRGRRRATVEAIAVAFEDGDLEVAHRQALRLRFYDRFLEEADRISERLDE